MPALSALFVVAVLSPFPDGAVSTADPTADQIRATVQRSIPYIEQQGVWWIEQKKCVTCHRVGNMVWTLGAARKRGFAVGDRLDEWTSWAIEKSLSKNDKDQLVGSLNEEGLAQLLFARRQLGIPSLKPKWGELVSVIADGQESDGSWKPNGQLPSQKRSKSETTEVTTMWVTLALAQSDSAKQQQARIDKAFQRIEASTPGKSAEWYVTRLLLARQFSDDTTAQELRKQLVSQQRDDGGWAWLAGDASDALGTGMSLYALLAAGAKRDDEAIRKAQRFLIGTQRDDGSWAVNGTKSNKRTKVQETASYWGTTWAALGLLQSLPEK